MTTTFNHGQCPFCGSSRTTARRGVGFEHERLCWDCKNSYDPDEELERYNQTEKQRLELNTHRE